jgi:hypothetical protein
MTPTPNNRHAKYLVGGRSAPVKKVMHLKGNGREKDGAMAETTTTSHGGATGMQGGGWGP